jgi:hypothetical protein
MEPERGVGKATSLSSETLTALATSGFFYFATFTTMLPTIVVKPENFVFCTDDF